MMFMEAIKHKLVKKICVEEEGDRFRRLNRNIHFRILLLSN